jgi:hypothetical protein
MTPVISKQVIVMAKIAANSNGNRFLTYAQMDGAFHVLEAIYVDYLLFKTPNQDHGLAHSQEKRFAEIS